MRDTLLITNDRAEEDPGSVLYTFDISAPSRPALISMTPVGLTGSGRGAGHIANFVNADCSQMWLDGGNLVEVFDSLGPGSAALPWKVRVGGLRVGDFPVSHDTERDSKGALWSTGGGGAAGYQLTADPRRPGSCPPRGRPP